MYLKILLSLFYTLAKYLQEKELLEAGESKAISEIQKKVIARVKIKIHNKLNVDSIPESYLTGEKNEKDSTDTR